MAAVKFAVSVVLAALIVVSIGRGGLALLARAESGDFISGTVTISAVPGGPLFTAHEAAPGDTLTGSIMVTNEGTSSCAMQSPAMRSGTSWTAQ